MTAIWCVSMNFLASSAFSSVSRDGPVFFLSHSTIKGPLRPPIRKINVTVDSIELRRKQIRINKITFVVGEFAVLVELKSRIAGHIVFLSDGRFDCSIHFGQTNLAALRAQLLGSGHVLGGERLAVPAPRGICSSNKQNLIKPFGSWNRCFICWKYEMTWVGLDPTAVIWNPRIDQLNNETPRGGWEICFSPHVLFVLGINFK